MIVWLNGTFGAGKTTAAHELLDLLPGSTLYDPELLGSGLRLMECVRLRVHPVR